MEAVNSKACGKMNVFTCLFNPQEWSKETSERSRVSVSKYGSVTWCSRNQLMQLVGTKLEADAK
jgi:hypothetical protein